MKKIFLFIFIACITVSLIAGCNTTAPAGSSAPNETGAPTETNAQNGAITEEDVAYAGPMVENMLAGITNKDYEVFCRDFSDAMKAAMTKEAFDSLVSMLESKIGDSQSMSFAQAATVKQDGVVYTVIVYIAKYSNEPGDVLITVTFGGEKGTEKVEGLLFNSPKLREQ